jgi:hypothetical protein
MSLASLVATMSQKAVDLIGDLKGTGTYFRTTNTGFDAATDLMTSTEISQANVPMVKLKSEVHEMEASPLTLNDAKFLIAKLDLTLVDEPNENDRILFEGKTYQVLRFTTPPSRPIWLIYTKEG